jgi:hypothetical protein
MEGLITYLVCAGFVALFALGFGTLVLMRWFRHKETLVMIQQGMVPPELMKKQNGKGMLVWGIGIAFFGLALLGALAMLAFFIGLPTAESGGGGAIFGVLWLVPGLVILFLGIALIIVYVVTRPAPAAESGKAPEGLADEGMDWPSR